MVLLDEKQKRVVVVDIPVEKTGDTLHGFFKLISRRKVQREIEGEVLAVVDNDELDRLIDLAFKSDEGWATNGFLLVRVLNQTVLSEINIS